MAFKLCSIAAVEHIHFNLWGSSKFIVTFYDIFSFSLYRYIMRNTLNIHEKVAMSHTHTHTHIYIYIYKRINKEEETMV